MKRQNIQTIKRPITNTLTLYGLNSYFIAKYKIRIHSQEAKKIFLLKKQRKLKYNRVIESSQTFTPGFPNLGTAEVWVESTWIVWGCSVVSRMLSSSPGFYPTRGQ